MVNFAGRCILGIFAYFDRTANHQFLKMWSSIIIAVIVIVMYFVLWVPFIIICKKRHLVFFESCDLFILWLDKNSIPYIDMGHRGVLVSHRSIIISFMLAK